MSLHERVPGPPSIEESPAVHSPHPRERNADEQEAQEPVRNTAKTDSTVESLLTSSSTTRKQQKSQHYKIWWQELAAATLLCAAVIASYATLAPFAGKSLPEWPRYITISALLSTYSVVLRLAAAFLLAEGLAQLKWRWFNKCGGVPLHDLVLHDSATRGPVGSLQLLWRLPLPITWQWLGCVLIIVSLAVGPLTQLVLQYEQCQVLMDQGKANAGIPRASVFCGQGPHSGAATISLTLDEQNAINSGIYNLRYSRPECSSGNCTFAPYTSIGFCSECDDISADVQFAKGVDSITKSPWVASFIPDDLSTTSFDDSVSSNYSFGFGNSDRNMAAASQRPGNGNVTYVTVMGPPRMTNDGSLVDCRTNSTWACRGYAATSCKMSPCIRNYTAAMNNGIFEEVVVDRWIAPFGLEGEWPDGKYFQSAINKSCLTEEQSLGLRAMNYTLDDSSPWLAYNGSRPALAEKTQNATIDLQAMEQDLLDRGCLYAIDYFFWYGLTDYLGSNIFNGNLTASYSASDVFLSFNGPQLMLAVYNNGDVSLERTQAVWENISLSLTNHMRMNPYTASQTGGGPPFPDPTDQEDYNAPSFYNISRTNVPAPGLSYATKTCLQVRWGWLAFPTALAALTLVFFAGVLLSSGGLTRDVRTWKSSPLPLLFFAAPLSDLSADSQHVSNLNQVARKVHVGLVRDEDGNMVLRKRGAMVNHDSEI